MTQSTEGQVPPPGPKVNTKKGDRDSLLRAAYTAATQRLRDSHRDAFNLLYAEEAKARGVEWKPKPTEAERAKESLATLLSDHPELFEEIDALRPKA